MFPNGQKPLTTSFYKPPGSNDFTNTHNTSAMDEEITDNLSFNSDNFSIAPTDLQGAPVQRNQFFKNTYPPKNSSNFQENNNFGLGNKKSTFRPDSNIIDENGFYVRVNFRNVEDYEVKIKAGIANNNLFINVPKNPTLMDAHNKRLINLDTGYLVEEFKNVCKKEGRRQAPLVYKSVLKKRI